jgi:zinc and cadmium transporter
MIPEMAEEPTFQNSLILLLVGIIGSFVIEKLIHWRHCHHIHCDDHVHPMGLINIIGDAAHNFIDGTLIAGSFLVSPELGITTTIAVALHEIPQEIGDFAVLLYSGYSKKRALLMNVLAASTGVLGAILVLITSSSVEGLGDILLPLAAGNFLYIAGVDLLPELHKETRFRNGMMQLGFLVVGILILYGLVTALPHATHEESVYDAHYEVEGEQEEDHDPDHLFETEENDSIVTS